jgi:hypothetical protein
VNENNWHKYSSLAKKKEREMERAIEGWKKRKWGQGGRERAGDREGVEREGERERERGWIQGRN